MKISKMETAQKTTGTQNFFRILLGLMMMVAGSGHLSFARVEFQAQVPDWVPMDKDLVVLLSGVVEILLGVSLITIKKYRAQFGVFLAIFYIMIFPGNIAQYLNSRDAFGLDTDMLRFIRLLFQPVLVIWALWSSGGMDYLVNRKNLL